ncbi:MAG: 2-aminoethylphosphonate-pyruvate transaminase [Saliniramus fredricksonii]|uniref:2-aminoethylphosphonate-pyruvate transaminase n=1 Tax=Saliniramus fredricksonii TaxID=1653334 RepID=A0A0P7Y7A8_9HYPH|nr:hypothetical protein [Saliniramus fredricksonii]KPQ10128.1 MAG: 2-aminoethylphosphonate-pyruvate transaminase [Saliniramus fredricksonii]
MLPESARPDDKTLASMLSDRGRLLVLDAMSSFGALPLDLRATRAAAVVAASGKCLESIPGAGFVLVDREAMRRVSHKAPSVALDLLRTVAQLRTKGTMAPHAAGSSDRHTR